ncbi:MAG: RHS repeat-associated core domain-containing protein, partial [Blastocatellia bacterium]|nr:RHS repeat-associated core domain-containing protein [Blastocatellia bacterium]
RSQQLGNGLYHLMTYNSRLQPTTIGLGFTSFSSDLWKLDYNYSQYDLSTNQTPTLSNNVSQNNGNIGRIRISTGGINPPIDQFFAYDELNRLKTAKEFFAQVTTFAPEFGFADPVGEFQTIIYVPGTSLDTATSIEITPSNGVSLDLDSGGFFVSGDSLGVFLKINPFTGAGLRTIKALNSQGQVLGQTNLNIVLPPTIETIAGGCCGESFNCTGGTYRVTNPNDPVNGILDIDATDNGDGISGVPSSVTGTGTFTVSFASSSFQTRITATNSFGQRTDVCLLNAGRYNPGPGDNRSQSPKDTLKPTDKPSYSLELDPDSLSWSQAYDYDRYGNRHTVVGTNAQNLSISTSKNRITDAGYEYDLAGNLIADPSGKFYEYDGENRLIKVAQGNQSNVIAEYFYDGNGWRVKKIANGVTTRFVYDQSGRLLAEYIGEPVPSLDAPTKEHIYGASGMLATVEADKINYHTPDHLGSPRILTDGSGVVISRRDFFPFGDQIIDSVGNRASVFGYSTTDSISQKFTGYFNDDESGLDFAQARYFNSSLGRFMSIDPVFSSSRVENPMTYNRYSYCLNNPINFSDPTGLYEFADNVDDEQKKNFRNALSKLKNESLLFKEGSAHRKRIEKILKAYGEEGKGGPLISFSEISSEGKTTYTYKSSFSNDGRFTSIDLSVGVIFNSNINNAKKFFEILLHEGQHNSDLVDFFGSVLGMKYDDAYNSKLNLTEFQIEDRGFEITQIYAVQKNQVLEAGDAILYDPSFAKIDETTSTLFSNLLITRRRFLEISRTYELTFKSPGVKILKEKEIDKK